MTRFEVRNLFADKAFSLLCVSEVCNLNLVLIRLERLNRNYKKIQLFAPQIKQESLCYKTFCAQFASLLFLAVRNICLARNVYSPKTCFFGSGCNRVIIQRGATRLEQKKFLKKQTWCCISRTSQAQQLSTHALVFENIFTLNCNFQRKNEADLLLLSSSAFILKLLFF